MKSILNLLLTILFFSTLNAQTVDDFKSRAELGDIQAQYEIGVLYIEQAYDDKKGIYWLEKSANSEYLNAIVYLANLYHGIAHQNPIKCLYYAEKAAQLGHTEMAYLAGSFYEEGIGTPVNKEMAEKYYKLSIKEAQPIAQYKLAMFYLYEKQDKNKVKYPKVLKYLRLSAKQGYAPAQKELGLMYAYGEGVKQDMKMSAYWIGQAIAQNNEDAKNFWVKLKLNQYVDDKLEIID